MTNKKVFLVLFCLLLLSAASQPAEEKTSGWITESAEEGANELAVAPVVVRPLELKPLAAEEYVGPHQALPPREQLERGMTKAEFFQRHRQVPSFIPQHSVQFDSSAVPRVEPFVARRIKSFKGLSESIFFPPDPVVAAGPQHVVVLTNCAIGIYTKTGKKLVETAFSTWVKNIPEVKQATLFDPKILYDQYAGHFVMLIDAEKDLDKTAYYLLSVSKTSDPTGEWVIYALNQKLNGRRKANNWADFPGLGIDEAAIYMTGNMFNFATNNFVYAKLRIVKKSQVYAFGNIGWFDRWNLKDATGHIASTVQPAQTFGTAPVEYLVSCDPIGGTKITLWYVPNPSAARPALKKKAVAVSSFEQPPEADQKGSTAQLNTAGADFRNAVFANGSIFTAQSLSHNWGSENVSAIRFYEISAAGKVLKEIEYGADKLFYFYPSVMVDSRGNVIIVFNRSGASEFGSTFFTGRKFTDPPGTLQASKALMVGEHAYEERATGSDTRYRWGDYTGVSLDADDSIWITGEWAVNSNSWATQIGRVKYR